MLLQITSKQGSMAELVAEKCKALSKPGAGEEENAVAAVAQAMHWDRAMMDAALDWAQKQGFWV